MSAAQVGELITALSEPQLEAELKVQPGTMRRMRKEGRGPRWVHVGRLVRYPKLWINEWLKANEGTLETNQVEGMRG